MRTARLVALVIGAASMVTVACQKVPFTGRKQLNLVPNSMMMGVGKSSYASMLDEVEVTRQGADHQVLQRVGGRISRSARQPEYDWQYSLINSDDVNAWCLPGGYIGFYSGILPVLESEAGMAFVMGHEVAHATARHGSERMSQQLAVLGGLGVLELFMASSTKIKPEQRGIILGALGAGAQLGIVLPFSRTHESEADVIGMMYMSKSGYPPEESKKVWDRMAALSPNSAPAFLSTHPSHEKRKANLQEWMPTAKKRYARNKLAADTLTPLWTSR